MSKLKVGVVFGGRSVEHEVSIITGQQAMENLNKAKYEILPLYLAKDGKWYTGTNLMNIDNFKPNQLADTLARATEVIPTALPQTPFLVHEQKSSWFKQESNLKSLEVDVLLITVHGTHGEDGSLQGLLELANIPYTSPGLAGSSVGMDKIAMKSALKGEGIPLVDYGWYYRHTFERDPQEVLADIEQRLAYPLIIKPASLGSSVGISKAKNRAELEQAITVACAYDHRFIVEKAVEQLIEINCSVLGIDDQLQASLCEQPVAWEEFLSYDDKYMRGNYIKNGEQASSRQIPADLPVEVTSEIQALAKQVFQTLDCKGVARIDFLMNKEEMKPIVNEINTIPGSLSFYLWEPTGLNYSMLLDKLIELAQAAQAEKEKNLYSIQSDLIQHFRQGSKTKLNK